ncbi:MAG: murein biosynthesis integral membrane protein MurJ, partial [Candidatus Omnitrophica bacterium]|nr:murein biosynthesis integral membrane protein MurJ [Candidatus Omnitrophota bacterium]
MDKGIYQIEEEMSTNKSITKAASIISLGTILSRILGFIRDITIANFFGTSYLAEAFFVAFRIPNLLRSLVGEGSINAAIVPVFSEYLVNKDKQELFRLVNIVMYFLIVALGLITICGIIFSPLIVKLIAPGFIKDALKFNLTIKLTRIMFPYLI